MSTKYIIKRMYEEYVKKYIFKIFLAAFFSILVAGSTSATAWLLDPAIENIFLCIHHTSFLLFGLCSFYINFPIKIFIRTKNPKKLLLLNFIKQSLDKDVSSFLI